MYCDIVVRDVGPNHERCHQLVVETALGRLEECMQYVEG